MAFHPTFNPLSFEQANPLITGLMQGQQFGQKMIGFPTELLAKKAQAASQLAYANLMGPQFLAKLMNNPQIIANLSPEQREQGLNTVYQAGTGKGTGQGFLNPFLPQALQKGSPQSNQFPQTYPSEDPYEGQVNRPNNYIPPSASSNEREAIIAKREADLTEQRRREIESENESRQNKLGWFEQSGIEQGKEKQGEKLGEIRAEQIKDFDDQVEGGLRLGDKFRTMNSLINNPVFRQMRSDIPYFQGTQLWVLKHNGTPEQKELIGQFENTANEIIRDTITTFPGRILKGEVDVAKNMKVSDSDTFDVIVGKVKQAEIYKELNMQRATLASDIMENKNLNKRDALKMADKQLNTQKIVDDINKNLDYTIQVRNKKTGKIESMPVSKARKLGIPNV